MSTSCAVCLQCTFYILQSIQCIHTASILQLWYCKYTENTVLCNWLDCHSLATVCRTINYKGKTVGSLCYHQIMTKSTQCMHSAHCILQCFYSVHTVFTAGILHALECVYSVHSTALQLYC